jgi:DNA-binding NarL/FixJ family response regulator
MLRAKADLILLDHAFGLRVIYDLLSALKRAIPPAQPVLWSAELSLAGRRLALEAGARGIVDPRLPVASLLDCLRSVTAGELWLGDEEAAPGLEPRGGQRLTGRERQVLSLVAEGLKNREIAQRLSITPGTVKVHMMHVFEKTGARDRFQLRLQATRLLEGEGAAETKPGSRAMVRGAAG